MPASATVTLKISPEQYNLITFCLESEMAIQQDLIDDPAVKEEDKQQAGKSMWEIKQLLQQVRS